MDPYHGATTGNNVTTTTTTVDEVPGDNSRAWRWSLLPLRLLEFAFAVIVLGCVASYRNNHNSKVIDTPSGPVRVDTDYPRQTFVLFVASLSIICTLLFSVSYFFVKSSKPNAGRMGLLAVEFLVTLLLLIFWLISGCVLITLNALDLDAIRSGSSCFYHRSSRISAAVVFSFLAMMPALLALTILMGRIGFGAKLMSRK
ncbi:hypothetical protein CXG81DRAFT_18647 [Caulochytrium protostelioides]|uniref:MARVEL domain-containing protein n=1 Tax=Caulochytrium protostelioides TaxID=1555241 RepID=A0A4P9X8J4_9FUNG|nr:hypothetical protein CXG81DRAFT_18647 [Caulochytrium protostelioides]|eukprot:RKP01596.1 hypothetical protein CXG81DRAFT_18647 [Caulochytrium protostelioides]